MAVFKGSVPFISPAKPDPNSYIDRVRTYVPVETIGFFVFVNSIVNLDVALTPAGTLKTDGYVAILAFLVGVLTTVALVRQRALRRGQAAWRAPAIFSASAFAIWSYAVNPRYVEVLANAEATSWLRIAYTPSAAAFMLGVFALFVAIFQIEPSLDESSKVDRTATAGADRNTPPDPQSEAPLDTK